MLSQDDACGTQHSGKQDKEAEPAYGIKLENETVGQQTADHHAAAGHVCTDFQSEIDQAADDHADHGGQNDSAHVAGEVDPVHREIAAKIT